MNYLFDSNVWIDIHRGDQRIRRRWKEQSLDSVFLCSPVLAELYVGALKSQKTQENLKFVDDILVQHHCLYFGIAEAARFAQLARAINTPDSMVKVMDLQIAAIASVHGLRVITHDVGDFRRIPGIDMEDWREALTP